VILPAERAELVARARQAAAKVLGVRTAASPGPAQGRLSEPGRVVVTWKRDGRPRGSAGPSDDPRPLSEEGERCAVAALRQDPRFAPATARDFPRLSVEIAVLGALEPLEGPEGIEIGRHGLAVRKGSRGSLLLPSAPLEWSWDARQFLEQLCLKAGLPGDAWETGRDLQLYRFDADVFGDSA
jgi:uncharacterized protein